MPQMSFFKHLFGNGYEPIPPKPKVFRTETIKVPGLARTYESPHGNSPAQKTAKEDGVLLGKASLKRKSDETVSRVSKRSKRDDAAHANNWIDHEATAENVCKRRAQDDQDLKRTTESVEKDKIDNRSSLAPKTPPTGITNFRQACFANAALQLLFSVPEMVEYLRPLAGNTIPEVAEYMAQEAGDLERPGRATKSTKEKKERLRALLKSHKSAM